MFLMYLSSYQKASFKFTIILIYLTFLDNRLIENIVIISGHISTKWITTAIVGYDYSMGSEGIGFISSVENPYVFLNKNIRSA